MADNAVLNLIFGSDDSEEEFPVRRPRVLRERRDYFEEYDDVSFKTRFRLSKESALLVLEEIEQQLEFPSERNDSLSPMNQLLLTLRFYATGSFFKLTGDFIGVREATAHRTVHRVSRAIAGLSGNHITFPETPEAIRDTQRKLYDVARFPRAIGLMDCTHIKILSPGGPNAEDYRNRKGFFSLNVQTICNANLEFTDIVARWPGSTHDATIFNASYRNAMFLQGNYGEAVLLGDSGYPLLPYVMTPFNVTATREEELFNESQIRTRNGTERLYGIWKRRFPVLSVGLRVHLENAFPIIIATAVLFNILRRNNDADPLDEPDLELPAPWADLLEQDNMGPQDHIGNDQPLALRRRGQYVRQNLVENYFARL